MLIKHISQVVISLGALALLLAACTAGQLPSTEPGPSDQDAVEATQPGKTGLLTTPDRSQLRTTPTTPGGLEKVEITTPEPVTGEVPPGIMEKILADLSGRTGVTGEDIQVVRAEAVVWNDGSLGCPQPGMGYIQILIQGYWVVLKVENTEFDYRVTDKGDFVLCEGGGALPISPPGEPGGLPAPDQ